MDLWTDRNMILKCPRCGKETESTANPFRPFCGERCQLIDLGKWLNGEYHIPARDTEEAGESTSGEDNQE